MINKNKLLNSDDRLNRSANKWYVYVFGASLLLPTISVLLIMKPDIHVWILSIIPTYFIGVVIMLLRSYITVLEERIFKLEQNNHDLDKD